jgi:hypothetical protein
MIVVIAEDINGEPPSQAYCEQLKQASGIKDVILLRDDASQIVSQTLGLNPVNHWHFVFERGMANSTVIKGKDSVALGAIQALIDGLQ